MAFTSYDEIIAAFAAGSGQDRFFNKTSSGITIGSAGNGYSFWMQGASPAAGVVGAGAAGTYTAQDDTTVGALTFANPGGSNLLHLALFGAMASAASGGLLMLYDRIGQVESLPIVGAPGTTAVSSSLSRYTTEGVQVMAEYASGTTTTTAPVFKISSYTNQDGTTGKASQNMTGHIGTGLTGRLAYSNKFFIDLAAGDIGVRSIEEYELVTANATASSKIQLVFAKPLAFIPLTGAGEYRERDLILHTARIPEIKDDACLAFAILPAGPNPQVITGVLTAVEG